MADFNDFGWRERAACLDHPQDWWFPSKRDGKSPTTIEAKRICREECPVLQPCLAYALDYRPQYGLWAGVGVGMLDKLRQQRDRAV